MAKAEKAKTRKTAPKINRNELVSKARFDYGILNAEDINTEQLLDEIAAIDKQAADAQKNA